LFGEEMQWTPSSIKHATDDMKKAIHTMTMIRSLHHESTMSLLPNELLFLIFKFLEFTS